MANNVVTAMIDQIVPFQLLVGSTIAVHVSSIEIGHSVLLKGQISASTCQQVLSTGTFHTDEIDDEPVWQAGTPIDIWLRLRQPVAARYSTAEALLQELLVSTPSPLRHTEAWLLLEAMQAVSVPEQPEATASFGFRTHWSAPLMN